MFLKQSLLNFILRVKQDNTPGTCWLRLSLGGLCEQSKEQRQGSGGQGGSEPLVPGEEGSGEGFQENCGGACRVQRPRGALRSLQEAEATPRAPMSRASLEGTGWGQGKVAGTIWQWGMGVALALGWVPGDAGAPSLWPRLLPDGHWASARHSAPGLIPKQNIWFPGLMALKCKYCFSVSNKQSHMGSRSPELATRRPPPLVRACRSGPSAPNTLEWGRDPLTGFVDKDSSQSHGTAGLGCCSPADSLAGAGRVGGAHFLQALRSGDSWKSQPLGLLLSSRDPQGSHVGPVLTWSTF